MNSTTLLYDLEPPSVFRHFLKFTGIARSTGNEQGMIDYLREYAKARPGIDFAQDEYGNVRLRVPAKPGREKASGCILQAHVDMVCTRDAAAGTHDPAAGRIRVIRVNEKGDELVEAEDGEYLSAFKTTLGADNGVGAAMGLGIVDDPEALHGPLDLCFTLHEEVGLEGAHHLDPGLLQGDFLLNLDSEDEDELTIGSAGGRDVQFRWVRELTPIGDNWSSLTLTVSGLRGGHSGLDINSGRMNAIRGLVRLMQVAADVSPVRLFEVKGGDRRNAIPRSAHAVVAIPVDRLTDVRAAVEGEWTTIKEQYRGLEPKADLALEEIQQARGTAFTIEATRQLIAGLRAIPAGVIAMSQDIPGLVETSNNLGVIDTKGDVVDWACSPRSSLGGAMKDITETLVAIAELAGASADPGSEYPGWKPEPTSPLLEVVKDAYERLFGSPVKVGACHAGLECSVIKAKLPRLDCISMGPTIKGAHSTTERVRIASVGKSYSLLKVVLDNLSARPADLSKV